MLAFLKQSLFKKGLGQNIFILAGGSAIGQGLVILSSPVLTRLFTPDEFGAYAVYASSLVILLAIASLRYEMAIPLPRYDKLSINLLVISFCVLFSFIAILSFSLVFWGIEIVSFLNAPQLVDFLWLFPLSLLGAGGYQILNAWAVRKKNFTGIAKTKLSQSIGMVSTQIGVGAIVHGHLGLLLGDAVGRTSGSVALAYGILKNDRKLFKEVRFSRLKIVLKRYARFPIFSSWSSALNIAGVQLPSILFASLYSPEVAGWFMLSQRIVGAPMSIVGQSVAQVYLSEISGLIKSNPQEAKGLFLVTKRRLFKFGIFPVLIIGAVAPLAFSFIFGVSWGMSGMYVLILSPVFLLQFVISPISHNAVVLERQISQLIIDISRFVFVIISIALPSFLGWSSTVAVICYSITMVLVYFLYLSFYTIIINQNFKKVIHGCRR